ncbi:MAG TPA: septal ring lytic transglycosylase RlpA family protein [Terracidiphilus sp.]|nr:septal ring lytic transglycosylase RlpA family protein [Terracidiphilus sp.]
MRQNANNVNGKDPVQLWLIIAASCIALAGLVLTVPARTVEADAVLSRPAATAPPAAPALGPTPVVAVAKKPIEKAVHGFASWYGGVFNGRLTASGEVFDQNELTACHPTLPFGTRVKVMNTRNHKAVVVRITDRGLLYGRRVIDLSYAAAVQIGMTEAGVVPVTIQVLGKGQSSN